MHPGAVRMRVRIRPGLILCLAAVICAQAAILCVNADEPALKPVAAGSLPPGYIKDVQPLLTKYCSACHQGEKPKAGVAFDTIRDERTALNRRQVWEKVLDQLQEGAMPPEEKPQPTDDERSLIMRWIESRVIKIDCSNVDPGRVTVRRLNKTEYNNTIRDLLGVEFKPAEDFPSDDVGYGFDHIGDVLSMPPVLFERYLAASERIVEAAIATPDPDRAPRQTAKGKTLSSLAEVAGAFK